MTLFYPETGDGTTRRTSGTDVSVAVLLAVLHILIAVILTLISLMEQFNFDAIVERQCRGTILNAFHRP
ncbi:hypothetical protein [Cryobacterium sp. HLT2-28]|uniref:hypothetical protein n=1 Tax=Cryobacterium sp. HLT2-28 TaxID=1259146 RepID=UPI00106CEFFB|nr:hypothetical protein [Cryobacterium sp. HLT2-28]TFB95909.1 hypothetical protein E3O48_05805 [Cryobacterium sp. HLT2-28]